MMEWTCYQSMLVPCRADMTLYSLSKWVRPVCDSAGVVVLAVC